MNEISRPFLVEVSLSGSSHSSVHQFKPEIPSLFPAKLEMLFASGVRLSASNPGMVLAAQTFSDRPSVVVFVQNMVLFRCRPGAAFYRATLKATPLKDCL